METLISRGVALARNKQRPEAIALFRRAATLEPNDTRAHYNLGVALAEEKNHVEAGHAGNCHRDNDSSHDRSHDRNGN
jgi:Flp pilus assembly protein TadD